MKKLLIPFFLLFVFVNVNSANAIPIDVYAYENSLKNVALDTGINLNVGDLLDISVATDDMWRAGVADRESNADGLGNPYGGDFGNYSSNGASFLYGSLVGQIGTGDYFLIGTSFSQTVSDAGVLKLLYWDSNYADNSGFITADVTATNPIPEPATLMLLGLGLIGIPQFRKRLKK
jgi:hypothetical protein